jgi:exodeoxyribonuclease V alpha subunit
MKKKRFERFCEFHTDNPHVFDLFVKFSRDAQHAGRTKLGARMVGERIRWFTTIETVSDDYKINDHFWPYYSRMLMLSYSEFAGFFERRNSRFDATDEQINRLVRASGTINMNQLSTHQSEQLEIALSAKVGVLTGSAGTGKSHTVQHYLSTLAPGSYLIVTPTGKAAQRLNEETEFGARTIHSALGTQRNGHDSDGWSFYYNEANRLPYETIVVDEAFMPSTETMADLFRAVTDSGRILLVGDPNQLPPVGHGSPAYDMLNSGVVPHGHLSDVWRYAGRIATVANAIKDATNWTPSPELDLENQPPENYKHCEAKFAPAVVNSMRGLMEKLVDRGYDPFTEVQVITWMNERGPVCRKKLNGHLQDVLNPNGETQNGLPFRLGDKIICTRNHSRKVCDADAVVRHDDQPDEIYIANGEIGRVVDWSLSKQKQVQGIIARFGKKRVAIHKGKNNLDIFDPAYAVTCHKFQGAQSKVVVVIADETADRVANRQAWYTAMTRAGELLITIGRMQTILRQCRTVDIVNRKTFLKETLQDSHQPLLFSTSELTEI